jgi:hypothetical protein
MRPAPYPTGHRVPRTKPTCLLHTWRPHRRRPFALVLHLHQHQSSRNLHLQYLAKNQSTQRCQSLITQGRDHPPVLEPHMVGPQKIKPSAEGFTLAHLVHHQRRTVFEEEGDQAVEKDCQFGCLNFSYKSGVVSPVTAYGTSGPRTGSSIGSTTR